jgi:hypothetical protein
MAALWASAAAAAAADPQPSASPTETMACGDRIKADAASSYPIAYLPGQAVRNMVGITNNSTAALTDLEVSLQLTPNLYYDQAKATGKLESNRPTVLWSLDGGQWRDSTWTFHPRTLPILSSWTSSPAPFPALAAQTRHTISVWMSFQEGSPPGLYAASVRIFSSPCWIDAGRLAASFHPQLLEPAENRGGAVAPSEPASPSPAMSPLEPAAAAPSSPSESPPAQAKAVEKGSMAGILTAAGAAAVVLLAGLAVGHAVRLRRSLRGVYEQIGSDQETATTSIPRPDQ